MTTRILTGITTSGIPHLGNYAGAIRPAIQASQLEASDAFFFMADYHALIKCDNPERVAQSRLAIAATWIAAGLDTQKVTFYRQSDVPEIPELNWVLSCVTAKGLMNRAHAYKAAQDQNAARNVELDDGVSMGLYCYPVLMAADILLFNAHQVPVGRDQIQHIEMARDIAQRFNHLYGGGTDIFTLPQALIEESVATLPGLDGRKMSKSYDNTIPLFEGSEADLRSSIMRIVTDSKAPGEAKDAEASMVYPLYKAFATAEQTQQFKADLEGGLGWGEAKQQLFVLLNELLAPLRERYQDLIAKPDYIEDVLQEGARKARAEAIPVMQQVREAIGLRNVKKPVIAAKVDTTNQRKGRFVSFREDQGFRFRLLDGKGAELFVSELFADPRAAGEAQKTVLSFTELSEFEVLDDQILIVLDNKLVAKVALSSASAVLATLEGMRA